MNVFNILFALFLPAVHSWRPMIKVDPIQAEGTYQYRPPDSLTYWEDLPSISLRPPTLGSPLSWFQHQPISKEPESNSIQNLDEEVTRRQPGTLPPRWISPMENLLPAPPPTPTTTTPPNTMVFEGHSKVTKYGPVEGSVNSVYLLSGKNV